MGYASQWRSVRELVKNSVSTFAKNRYACCDCAGEGWLGRKFIWLASSSVRTTLLASSSSKAAISPKVVIVENCCRSTRKGATQMAKARARVAEILETEGSGSKEGGRCVVS